MKRKSILTLIISSILLFGFTSTEPPKLGKQIYDAICNNDLEKVKSFIVTAEEIATSIENSEMDDDQKANLISQFSKRLKAGEDEKNQQIEKAFSKIRANMESKDCVEALTLGEITSKTHTLKNRSGEIGYLRINYSCNSDMETIRVTVIKTDFGWRILDNLRLMD